MKFYPHIPMIRFYPTFYSDTHTVGKASHCNRLTRRKRLISSLERRA